MNRPLFPKISAVGFIALCVVGPFLAGCADEPIRYALVFIPVFACYLMAAMLLSTRQRWESPRERVRQSGCLGLLMSSLSSPAIGASYLLGTGC